MDSNIAVARTWVEGRIATFRERLKMHEELASTLADEAVWRWIEIYQAKIESMTEVLSFISRFED